MRWTGLHAEFLAKALEHVLGHAEDGAMGFVRCLAPEAVTCLACDSQFAPHGWDVRRVTDEVSDNGRSITADQAVELREAKGKAVILLVDPERAGAGMDGIYSAAREAEEEDLFDAANRLALQRITKGRSRQDRTFAERAIRVAGRRGRYAISRWAIFDFLCLCATGETHPGVHLHRIGLWPIVPSDTWDPNEQIGTSQEFVERLLGPESARKTPAERIADLRIDPESEQNRGDLERFLLSVDAEARFTALQRLADRSELWIGNLKKRGPATRIRGIELTSWRNKNGSLARWSGLRDSASPDGPPVFLLHPDAENSGRFSTLEVRWRPVPFPLEESAVEYDIRVITGLKEELAASRLSHKDARGGEKHRFRNDHFESLDEGAIVPARVTLSVVGRHDVEPQESEEFIIRFGEVGEEKVGAGAGKRVRAFSEGLADVESRGKVADVSAGELNVRHDAKKGTVVLRTKVLTRSLEVPRPALVAEVEQQWSARPEIGRWQVRVRASGVRVGSPDFVPLPSSGGDALWSRAEITTRRLAERFGEVGGVGQIYDDGHADFRVVQEYLRVWAELLNAGDPSIALAQTVEVRDLGGHTIGLIVLPGHPLRVAWLAAYDNLVFHARFEEGQNTRDVLRGLASLDGALCPAFLPGTEPASPPFVFADTLGFHTVGMVLDTEPEPKAAAAILSRALEPRETEDVSPAVGKRSAAILGGEIRKYLNCHDTIDLLHLHALRAGDGASVARALGEVRDQLRGNPNDEQDDGDRAWNDIRFSLQFFSAASRERRSIAARFLAQAREKRRSGAGVLPDQDRWMLDSVSHPSRLSLPRLRWARRETKLPESHAHLAIAFDTFESSVTLKEARVDRRPFHAFGLLAFYDRQYATSPRPVWTSASLAGSEGEKHPSRRSHTEILARLHAAVQNAVARQLGDGKRIPVLHTVVSPEKEESLAHLHRLSDWVVTLDRNAGLEYFDSPRDRREIYDAYVIDCVPEREDLGSLQLITSTASLDEIRTLFDATLEMMGLTRSRKNAEFLMEQLKALSGRLAIRLTGQRPPTAELIGLALTYHACRRRHATDDSWLSLEDGFFVPVDDVRDVLPDAKSARDGEEDPPRSRPDLIHVSLAPRRGLAFRLVEVKYRRHLSTARAPEMLRQIREQTDGFRRRWEEWYGIESCSAFRAIRRARLSRILRFYADKARRHRYADEEGGCEYGLTPEQHERIRREIDRMISRGGDYELHTASDDRGFIFCPEQPGDNPTLVAEDAGLQIFLFGPRAVRAELDLAPSQTAGPSVFGDAADTDQASSRISSGRPLGPRLSVGAATTRDAIRSETATRFPEAVSESPAHTNETSPRGTEPLGGSDEPAAITLGEGINSGRSAIWPLTTKGNPHLLIAGLPGMGKTTSLLNLCTQMIENGISPIIFSWHQDIDERLEELVGPLRHVDFDGLSFNPLEVPDRTSRRAWLDVAGTLRDIFQVIYPELGDLQSAHVWRAIKESFEETGWSDSAQNLSELREPEFGRFLQILRSRPKPDRGLKSLLNRLEELEAYGFFTAREDEGSLWSNDAPTVIRVHQTQNERLQRAFSSLVFYSLYKNMFRRGIRSEISHAVIFDEAHRAAGLKLIPTMAKECRKYGISLVLASQEARDFHTSVFSAIANYLVLRLTETDARTLVRNVASSREERGQIDRIKQMERFRALYFREGEKRPAAIRLSEPPSSSSTG